MDPLSRRAFLRGAGTVTAGVIVIGSIGPTLANITQFTRDEAWQMHEQAIGFMAAGNREEVLKIWTYLYEKLPTVPGRSMYRNEITEEAVIEEVRMLCKRPFECGPNFFNQCSVESFAVLMVRDGLKSHQLPLVRVLGWKKFAKRHVKIVMAA